MTAAPKYPRHPTGPSGFGEAGVRRVKTGGGRYQRTRPSTDVLSVKSGQFSRVVVEGGIEYLAAATDGQRVYRDTRGHLYGFMKSLAKPNPGSLPISLGNGVFLTQRNTLVDGGATDQFLGYNYEVRPGVFEQAAFRFLQFTTYGYFGAYYLQGVLALEYWEDYNYKWPTAVPSGTAHYFRTADELAYFGDRSTVGRFDRPIGKSAIGVGSHFTRKDSANRWLHDVVVYRMNRWEDVEAWVLSADTFTRANAEFWPIQRLVVLKDFTVVLMSESFFRPGLYDDEEDYRPKYWMAITPNEGFGDFSYADVTPTLFPGSRVPSPLGVAPNQYFGVNTGDEYNADLSATLQTMRLAVVGDNEIVLAWQQRMTGGWRQRVGRVAFDGSGVTVHLTYESADVADRADLPLWQSLTHAGAGTVLAKVLSGNEGIGLDVTFRRSDDGGMTWGAPFAPTGFDAPLLNQYFGTPAAHEAYKPDPDPDRSRSGMLLVNSWRPENQTYYIYESTDVGASWKRRGRVYKPSAFRRIDSIISGDGGGNFQTLQPGPALRHVDVTLPDRYKGRT